MNGIQNENQIEVPTRFSGQSLAELLKPVKKKEKPQANIVKSDGEEGTIVLKGVHAIYRGRNGNAGGVRRGEEGLQMGNARPVRPDRITQGEE